MYKSENALWYRILYFKGYNLQISKKKDFSILNMRPNKCENFA